MKNSKFQKAYLQIIAEEKTFISNVKKNKIIEQDFSFGDIPIIGALGKGVVNTLGGLGDAGVSLAKGDLKGVGKGLVKTVASPVKMVADVAAVPIDMVKGAAKLVTSDEVKNNDKAQTDFKKLISEIPDDALKAFREKYPQLKDKSDDEVKQIMIMVGMSQNIQHTVQIQHKDGGDDKKGDNTQMLNKIKEAMKDFKDGKYKLNI